MSLVQRGILNKITHERIRQDRKWGEQNHGDAFWYVILGEEFGEVGRAIFEGDVEELKDELVQVAAVAVGHLEAIERRVDEESVDNCGQQFCEYCQEIL